jgi:hypothetical protein
MPEGLATPDGTPVDADQVQREFARAMASPPEDDVPAPPMRPADDGPAEKPKRTRKPRTVPPKPTDKPGPAIDKQRREGVGGLVQVAAGLCLVADQRTEGVAFAADALTLANSSEQLATACVATAQASPQFARVLDKVTAAGPYAALLTVALSVGGQIARNHGVILGEALGAVPPEQLLASIGDGDQAAA